MYCVLEVYVNIGVRIHYVRTIPYCKQSIALFTQNNVESL